MKFTITYTGGIDTALDDKIMNFFEKELGCDFIGSGMDLVTKIRDFSFEKVKGYVTAVDPTDPLKGNKFVKID